MFYKWSHMVCNLKSQQAVRGKTELGTRRPGFEPKFCHWMNVFLRYTPIYLGLYFFNCKIKGPLAFKSKRIGPGGKSVPLARIPIWTVTPRVMRAPSVLVSRLPYFLLLNDLCWHLDVSCISASLLESSSHPNTWENILLSYTDVESF